MKTLQIYKRYTIPAMMCFFVMFMALKLSGQNGQTVRFSYKLDNEHYEGSFKVLIGQTKDNVFWRDLTNETNPVINFNNIENGGIRVIFSALQWEYANHIRNELHFNVKDLKLPKQLSIASGRQAKLKTDERIEIDFHAIGNGNVELVLPFKIFHARSGELIGEVFSRFNFSIQNIEEVLTPEITNEIAMAAWRQVNQRDIEAVRQFEKTYAQTASANLARDLLKLMEQYPWDEVSANKDPETLRLIAYEYAKYPYQAEVKKLLGALDDEKFQQASKTNTVNAYREYLEEFPAGKHVAQANAALRNLGQQVSADEEAWYKTLENRSVSSLTQFIREWPASRFVANAQKLLTQLTPLNAFIVAREKKEEGELFTLKFENVQSRLIVDAVSGTGDRAGISYDWKDETTLEVLIRDEKSRTIHVTESGGASTSIELDVTSEALFVQLEREFNQLKFNILGGKPPYEVHFYPQGKDFPIFSINLEGNGESQQYTISLLELPAQMKGTFVLQIRDSRKTEVFEFDGIPINTAGARQYGLYFYVAIIAGLFGLLYVYRLVRRSQLKANEKAIQQKIQQRNQRGPAMKENKHIKPEREKMVLTNNQHSGGYGGAKKHRGESKGIVIKGNRKATIQLSEKQKSSYSGIPGDDAVVVDLNKVWADTVVGQVFFQKDMLSSLHNFLEEHQWREVREHNNTSIPEVGGFLMGTFMENPENGQFDIHIINFVPVTPEKHDVYKIEFGTAAWTELADIQDQYSHLNTIGWFHTHPGHGLFLSMPDLRIQKGFFGLPYQVAMEIDPLSSEIDMAIFTQKRNGDINNSSDRLSNVGWYRWNDIMEQVNR